MSEKSTYKFYEFWDDLRAVNQARGHFDGSVSFDDNVLHWFESVYGISDYTTWRFGRYMLVAIYINTNKKAFDVDDWAVAGSADASSSLISVKLASRVFKYAMTHPIRSVQEFPPPSCFISDEAV